MRKSGHRRPKGRGGNKNRNKNSNSSSQNNQFTGRNANLGVYTTGDGKGAVLYTKTTRKIATYARTKYSKSDHPVIGNYVQTAIMTLQEPPSPFVRPTRPPAATEPKEEEDGTTTTFVVDPLKEAIYYEEVKQYVKDEHALQMAMKDIYWIIWDQVSEELRCHLRVFDETNYNTYSSKLDSLALLKAIRSEMTGFTGRKYLALAIYQLMMEFYSYKQGRNMTNQEYFDEFQILVAIVEDSGASIDQLADHPAIQKEVLEEIAVDKTAPTIKETERAHKMARERYLAVMFLYKTDPNRYWKLIRDIEMSFVKTHENSSYPQTVMDAYQWLTNYIY